jgi:hypothetical protein
MSLLALAIGGGACDRPKGPSARPPQGVWAWDLSTGEEVSRVGWPASVTDDIWFIDGPQDVDLVLRGGERGRVSFYKAKLRRNGGKLVVVSFEFPNETAEDAHARAVALARQWQINDVSRLDAWHASYKDRGDRGMHYREAVASRHDLPQPRGVSIGSSFKTDKPFFVRFGFGWSTNEATVPGTAPRAAGATGP